MAAIVLPASLRLALFDQEPRDPISYFPGEEAQGSNVMRELRACLAVQEDAPDGCRDRIGATRG